MHITETQLGMHQYIDNNNPVSCLLASTRNNMRLAWQVAHLEWVSDEAFLEQWTLKSK